MQLGMIGLGRMGANMVRRLTRTATTASSTTEPGRREDARGPRRPGPRLARRIRREAVQAAGGLADGAGRRGRRHSRNWPRCMEAGDIIIDGGNSYYHDDLRASAGSRSRGIHYVDGGTSGGVWGSERGYCLMIGGEEAVVQRLDPIFAALAPSIEAAPRTPGSEKRRRHRRARLPALRPERRGPLRQDGPQRHRVRHHGRLCGRLNILRHANAGKQQQRRRMPKPRRCATPSTTNTI